jgi:hypothetical protein
MGNLGKGMREQSRGPQHAMRGMGTPRLGRAEAEGRSMNSPADGLAARLRLGKACARMRGLLANKTKENS